MEHGSGASIETTTPTYPCADIEREIKGELTDLLELCFFGLIAGAIIGSIKFTKWSISQNYNIPELNRL